MQIYLCSYNVIETVAQANGEHEKSLKQAQKVLREVDKWADDEITNRHDVVANLHSLIGNAHLELGNYGKALDHHQKDKDISEQKYVDIFITSLMIIKVFSH